MEKKSESSPNGELKKETTAPPQALQSSGVGQLSILDMSDSTVPTSPSFQATGNLQEESPNATNAHLVQAFAAKLGALVEWHRIELGDGREMLALCFPLGNWEVSEHDSIIPR